MSLRARTVSVRKVYSPVAKGLEAKLAALQRQQEAVRTILPDGKLKDELLTTGDALIILANLSLQELGAVNND